MILAPEPLARATSTSAPGERDPGWYRRLTEVGEDGVHGHRLGDEGDYPHLAPTLGHAVVTVAVDPRWRQQRGEAVEQLQRRQEQWAAPARTGLGSLVEQTLRIEFA